MSLSRDLARRRALATLALLSLAGCAGEQCAPLAGGRYCLQPDRGGPDFAVLQEVIIERAGRRELFVASAEKEGAVLRFALLTGLGQTLLTGESGPAGTRLAGPLAAHVAPALPAAMLEIALWPEHAVRDGLRDGLELRDAPALRRLVDREGRDALVIDYFDGDARRSGFLIHLPAMGVQGRVSSLEPAAGRGSVP